MNWSSRIQGKVKDYFEPSTLRDLVKVIADASQAGREIRVVGSLWAFEDIAFSSDVIVSLALLNNPLSRVLGEALTPVWRGRQNSQVGDRLFHVEAGITIAALSDLLDRQQPKLAMKTLGGSNGQTLAGALTTGTHGGDVSLPPLADMLVAIHLVAGGGQEIWVERESEPVTSQPDLTAVLWSDCIDTRIVRNDDLFDALLISLGRFGVIYSCIVKVRDAFDLAEWTTVQNWSAVRNLLQTGVEAGTFLAPLLNSLPDPPAALGAEELQSPVGLEIVLTTVSPNRCWIKRRWTTSNHAPLGIEVKDDALCVLGFAHFVGLVNASFDALIAAAAAGTLLNPLGGAIALTVTIAAKTKFDNDLNAIPNHNIGDILSLFFNTLWDLGVGFISGSVAESAFNGRYETTTTTGKRGPAHIIKTGWPQESQQSCYRADSVEPAFDATSMQYLRFLDDVIGNLPKFKQAGYMSLRYSTASRGLLSMHKVAGDNAVSIEVTSLRSLKDNAEWMRYVEASSLVRAGRPHWGQINSETESLCWESHQDLLDHIDTLGLPPPIINAMRTASESYSIYGEDLKTWRSALAAVSNGKNNFSNNFTRSRRLEPTAATWPLDLFDPAGTISALNLLLLS